MAEAEVTQAWPDLVWITSNRANALRDCGQLAPAQEEFRKSARLYERLGRSALYVLGNELEALRIDLRLGRAAEALPEIEFRLTRIRAWWEATRRGETIPDAPNAEFLGRVFIGALNIAGEGHLALGEWEPMHRCTGEIIDVLQDRGAPRHEIAIARVNRYMPLLRLGRLGEAQHELEQCLEVFENAGDALNHARALTALAHVFYERGDLPKAIALERRALVLKNTLPDPADRAITHNNLGNYLERAGHLAEAAPYELAALIYRLVIGHGQDLQSSAHNHVQRILRARRSGREHTLPRVADLVTRPDFASLRDWLTAGKLDLDRLQQEVDAFVARCRAEAERTLAEESS